MPKPKVLSGGDVLKIFFGFGFEIVSQRGSHVKLRRILADGLRQTLTIPNHKELDRGTLLANLQAGSTLHPGDRTWAAFLHIEKSA